MGSDDKTRLSALLRYWVEHNQEHSEEIGGWADRAGRLGGASLAEGLRQAAAAMDEATRLLAASLKRLEEVSNDVSG